MITIVADDPGQHHAAPAAVGEVGETGEAAGHRGGIPSGVEIIRDTLEELARRANGVASSIGVRLTEPRASALAQSRPVQEGARSVRIV